jgi:hypothetical protein
MPARPVFLAVERDDVFLVVAPVERDAGEAGLPRGRRPPPSRTPTKLAFLIAVALLQICVSLISIKHC